MQMAAAAAMAAKAAISPTNFLKIMPPDVNRARLAARRGSRGQQQADQHADAERGAGGREGPFADPLGHVLLRLVKLLAGGVAVSARLGAELLDALGDGALDTFGGVGEGALRLGGEFGGLVGGRVDRGRGILGGMVDAVRGHWDVSEGWPRRAAGRWNAERGTP